MFSQLLLHCWLLSTSTSSSATAKIVRDAAIQGHPLCQSTRHDFLLALSSNVTSIFNRSCTPSLHIHTPRLFQVELEKRQLGVGGNALVARCPEHSAALLRCLWSAKIHRVITMYARPRRTNASRAKKGTVLIKWRNHSVSIFPWIVCEINNHAHYYVYLKVYNTFYYNNWTIVWWTVFGIGIFCIINKIIVNLCLLRLSPGFL